MSADPHQSGQAAVSQAVQLAQEAVAADNSGDAETAVQLYTWAVDLIAYGLSVTEEGADTSTLLRYSSVYSARIADLTNSGALMSGRSAGSSSSGSAFASGRRFDAAGPSGDGEYLEDDIEAATPTRPGDSSSPNWSGHAEQHQHQHQGSNSGWGGGDRVDDLDDLDGRRYHPATFHLLDCAVERALGAFDASASNVNQ